MAVPGKISVYRGNTVIIPLRATGRTPGQTRFIFRTEPKSGTLGEIMITGPTTAEVAYTHNDGPAGLDQFAYAVKAADTPVSASAKISIAIVEQPSELTVTGDMEFGEVNLGEFVGHEFIVKNKGGGVLEGKLEVPPPWRIDSGDEFRLGRYEGKKVVVIFAPEAGKKYEGEFVFGGIVMAELGSLTGTGVAPLEIPTSIELKAGLEGLGRSGILLIRNRTSQERQVEFKTPEGIIPIPAITLAPESEQKVAVATAQDFLASMDSRIDLRSEAFVAEIPVRVYSAPPVLKITTDTINFATIEAGREYRQKFELTNTGGSDARISAKSGEDLLVIPDPDTVVLAPGHSRVFEMVVQTIKVGDLRETVQIGAGAAKPVAVSVEAQVVAPNKPVEDSPSTVGIPLVATMEPSQPEGSINPSDLGDIQAINSARLIKRTPWRVVLSWKKPSGKVGSYFIEGRYLVRAMNGGQPEIKWETWKGITFREEGDRVVADIRNLPSGGKWFIRMRSVDAAGKQSAPSPTFQISTSQPPAIWPWVFAVVAIIAGIVLVRAYLGGRRSGDAEDAARISQIGK
jgi:hypothetical protein